MDVRIFFSIERGCVCKGKRSSSPFFVRVRVISVGEGGKNCRGNKNGTRQYV